MDIILKYFPDLTGEQKGKFQRLFPLYSYWNSRINVISRKDIDHLYERHVLHALAIAKLIRFKPKTHILDAGTGGGFPGIPLAIIFPDVSFHLVDSIGKKIKVVDAVTDELGLKNIKTSQERVENIGSSYDFVISRAVTELPKFCEWVKHLISSKSVNTLQNGIIYLKGGEVTHEVKSLKMKYKIYPISDYFEESFFETKKIVHLY
jgi:16S rRNA (guanine527-N7)-methyltransferase